MKVFSDFTKLFSKQGNMQRIKLVQIAIRGLADSVKEFKDSKELLQLLLFLTSDALLRVHLNTYVLSKDDRYDLENWIIDLSINESTL